MRLIFHGHWKGWFRRWPQVVLQTRRATVFKAPTFEIEGDDHVPYMTSARVHAKGIIRRRRYIVLGAPDRMIAISTAGFKIPHHCLLRHEVSAAGDVTQYEERLT